MEKHFLEDFIRSRNKNAKLGAGKDQRAIWYNKAGDCLELLTVDEPFLAYRVDKYLTLFRSADSHQLIGFKIKDVKALIERYSFDGMVIKAGVLDKRVISIVALLIKVLSQEDTPTINRQDGYAEAIEALRTVPSEGANVEVPA